jgi:hypothetical protein
LAFGKKTTAIISVALNKTKKAGRLWITASVDKNKLLKKIKNG